METYMNDFELHDFIEDPNFDQFIDLIRGENADPVNNFDCDMLFNGYLVPNQFVSTTSPPTNMFDSNGTVYDPNSIPMMSTLSSFNGEVKGGDDHEENDEEDSSATTYTTTTTTTNTNSTTKRPKDDRSRTLVSERRRRGRMKEKLYALRALVPNITKMDKASIVGDAVLYVKDLQAQAKKLKAEIAGLEASVLGSEKYQGSLENQMRIDQVPSNNQYLVCKKIMQMGMFQVEERGFYVRLVSNRGEGVAASLYKALESLAGYNVQNSNLATASERFILTFTLNVKDSEQEINLPNLKLWVTGALLNQGFEFVTSFSA